MIKNNMSSVFRLLTQGCEDGQQSHMSVQS